MTFDFTPAYTDVTSSCVLTSNSLTAETNMLLHATEASDDEASGDEAKEDESTIAGQFNRWKAAFSAERRRVEDDALNGFELGAFRTRPDQASGVVVQILVSSVRSETE